ncbi:hypothetical protein EUTSA_v10017300mg [Eutrema salsugineum]|uniref:CR-type domain-containing protein n=1 Tax=Eutrema salsugineum TaxID=72664 RepID=V4M868_EUTSA|nr:hypothetical protein EUTSA_v10017300mg [Eutrema salsugineum]
MAHGVPNSETVEKCCTGRGEVVCPTCNADGEPGFYKENQMMKCSSCYGRGLIAHKDGSDTICAACNGKGKLPCPICQSRGLIKCQSCNGTGSLLTSSIAVVRWKTFSKRKVSATRGAGLVPEEIFHRAEGVSASLLCRLIFPQQILLRAFSFYIIGFGKEIYMKDYYPARFCWGLCPCL